jgi:Ca2+-binding EF-hand superfamily protein
MKRLFVLPVAVMALFGLGTAGLMAQKKSPEARFAKMDKNGDKKLSPEEFPGKKQADKSARPKKRFKKLDKDNDGFLTLDEYKAAKKK